ncbi:hypothetical protein [Methylococcus sp. Mc7]|uniref:hypothetical protein n=1 Tax=Methylococcus sp. Mc7 TaxID=2860258 RepID=UPI00210217FA|nr:hypothetical protein [Methylococcus sp. Mc7]
MAMLSEGWDAANVTHIMGLRAFTSQLLCEQVIGRGLRRVAYERDEDGLFLPEYVNVFGVPLSIFQDVGEGGTPPPPPKPSVQVEVVPGRHSYEIRWPNVLRVDTVLRPCLVMDWDEVEPLALDPMQTPIHAEIAPALAGQADLSKMSEIDLEKAAEDFRLQNLIFRAARKLYLQSANGFSGDKQYLAVQLIRLVEQLLASDKLDIPSLWHQHPVRRRILLAMNMDTMVGHVYRFVRLWNLIRLNNGKTLVLEVKGQDSERNRAKRAAMDIWIQAVNEQGGFGQWCFDVIFEPAKMRDTLLLHAG